MADMPTQAPPQAAPQSAQPPDPSQQQPSPQDQPADPSQQALTGADAGGARAVGTAQQAQDAQQSLDPAAPTAPDASEQAEYEQFVSRFTMILSDTGSKRPAHATGPSTHDAILRSLNNSSVPLPVAIGTTTAQVAFMIVQQAQASKVTYSPEVLFHACVECVALVYLTGLASKIFKGCPPFKGMQPDGQYDFSDWEIHLICAAQMQAVRVFGTMELKAGMISADVRQQNMQFWTEQVHREVASGAVNEDVLHKISSSGVLNKQQGSGDPTGAGPQPASAQPQPPQPQDAQQPPPQAAAAPPAAPAPGAQPVGGQ